MTNDQSRNSGSGRRRVANMRRFPLRELNTIVQKFGAKGSTVAFTQRTKHNSTVTLEETQFPDGRAS